MKHYIFLWLLLSSSISLAKGLSYICSYPGYITGKPVILKIKVGSKKAMVGGEAYTTLSNTSHGLVLAKSFAYDKNNIGMFGIAIDKKKLFFTRGNILSGENSSRNVDGKCIKN